MTDSIAFSDLSYSILKDLDKGRNYQSNIAEKLDTRVENINRKLHKLKEYGLVEQGERNADGILWHLTDKGSNVLTSVRKIQGEKRRIENIIEAEK